MATAGEMIKVIADAITRPQATVTSYYAVLRKGGLISTTGRGKSAQHLSSLDVARILIVMLSADALQEGEAVTELVGDLEHVLGDHDFNVVYQRRFEDALAHLIKFKAAKVHGRPAQGDDVLGDLDSNDIEIRVTATHLNAQIFVGGRETDFTEPFGRNPGITYPDDWDEIEVIDRLIVRATMGGMSVTRSVDQSVIAKIAAAMP